MPAELKPVYVLSSQEPILVQRELADIRDRAVPENLRGFNYDVMVAKTVGVDGILSAAQTLPMMAERRMVLCRDIDALAAKELAKLIPYVEAPNPSTVLVFLAKKVDKRVKFFAAAKKAGWLVELKAPRNVSGWVKEEARSQGVKISSAAERRLADAIGSDLARLSMAVEQLAVYAGGQTVEVEHVDDLIADTREHTVFELTDAIGAGNAAQAAKALGSLADQRQNAIAVTTMLARHMRQLGWVIEGRRQKLNKADLARKVGAPPFVVDKLSSQAQRFSAGKVARALERLSVLDQSLKGRAALGKSLGRDLSHRALLSRAVLELLD